MTNLCKHVENCLYIFIWYLNIIITYALIIIIKIIRYILTNILICKIKHSQAYTRCIRCICAYAIKQYCKCCFSIYKRNADACIIPASPGITRKALQTQKGKNSVFRLTVIRTRETLWDPEVSLHTWTRGTGYGAQSIGNTGKTDVKHCVYEKEKACIIYLCMLFKL